MRKLLCGVLFLTALHTPLLGQTGSDDFKKLSLEELLDLDVTSVSRRAEPLGQAAAAVSVLTSEDIRRLLASLELTVDLTALDPGKPLSAQGVDSLDMIQLFFECEQEFGVKISEKVLANGTWNTLDGIGESVNRLIAAQQK